MHELGGGLQNTAPVQSRTTPTAGLAALAAGARSEQWPCLAPCSPHTQESPHGRRNVLIPMSRWDLIGNEGPKINRAKAQVRASSVGILRLGVSSACQRLSRAPRFSAALASHQQPWEERSALPKLSLLPLGSRLGVSIAPRPGVANSFCWSVPGDRDRDLRARDNNHVTSHQNTSENRRRELRAEP